MNRHVDRHGDRNLVGLTTEYKDGSGSQATNGAPVPGSAAAPNSAGRGAVVGPASYGARVPEPIIYESDRPDVEVLWEGAWCPGELWMQRQDEAGQWWCNVQYRRPGELSSHL